MPASEQVMTRRTCSNAAFSVAAVGHTILVVDRDPQTLASALEHLRSAGYRASGVESFHEARQLLPTIQPDVLIADVRLGAFNGLRLVTQRHAEHPGEPSIVTHAYLDPVLRRKALQLDVPYLVKPIYADVLLGTVAELLAQRSADTRQDGPCPPSWTWR